MFKVEEDGEVIWADRGGVGGFGDGLLVSVVVKGVKDRSRG